MKVSFTHFIQCKVSLDSLHYFINHFVIMILIKLEIIWLFSIKSVSSFHARRCIRLWHSLSSNHSVSCYHHDLIPISPSCTLSLYFYCPSPGCFWILSWSIPFCCPPQCCLTIAVILPPSDCFHLIHKILLKHLNWNAFRIRKHVICFVDVKIFCC